jgi:hypothetical protein
MLRITVVATRIWYALFMRLAGCGFASVRRATFENNQRATFFPAWYSLAAVFVLFRDFPAQRLPI